MAKKPTTTAALLTVSREKPDILPYSEKFSEALAAYCTQTDNYNQRTHHMMRIALLLLKPT